MSQFSPSFNVHAINKNLSNLSIKIFQWHVHFQIDRRNRNTRYEIYILIFYYSSKIFSQQIAYQNFFAILCIFMYAKNFHWKPQNYIVSVTIVSTFICKFNGKKHQWNCYCITFSSETIQLCLLHILWFLLWGSKLFTFSAQINITYRMTKVFLILPF